MSDAHSTDLRWRAEPSPAHLEEMVRVFRCMLLFVTNDKFQVKILRAAIPERVYVRDTPEYEDARNGFWALEQAQCKPHCIVQPCKSQELSDVMRILRNTGSPFGVKSGGHGRLAGESSVSSGVLIDLKRLDKVELSADKTSCKVGPGNNWKSVYGHLNPQGLMVVGGRASTVGVGGFCVSGKPHFTSLSILFLPTNIYQEEYLSSLTVTGGH